MKSDLPSWFFGWRHQLPNRLQNRGDLEILVEGDTRLFNQYGVIVVDPAKHPHVKRELAQAFADWVVSPPGQETIAGYKIGGQQLFFPNAKQ